MSTYSFAGVWGDLTLSYIDDGFVSEETTASNKTYFGLDIMADLDNKAQFYAGFHVHQISLTETADETISLTSLDMGPMFMWVIDQKRNFSVTVGYNVIATGTYSDGSDQFELQGTGFYGAIALMPEIKDRWNVGFKLLYLSESYGRSILDNEASDISYSRTLILPVIALSYRN